jgi:hypothetical protein
MKAYALKNLCRAEVLRLYEVDPGFKRSVDHALNNALSAARDAAVGPERIVTNLQINLHPSGTCAFCGYTMPLLLMLLPLASMI